MNSEIMQEFNIFKSKAIQIICKWFDKKHTRKHEEYSLSQSDTWTVRDHIITVAIRLVYELITKGEYFESSMILQFRFPHDDKCIFFVGISYLEGKRTNFIEYSFKISDDFENTEKFEDMLDEFN